MKIIDIEEIKDFEINDELCNFLKKIYTYEKMLNNDEIRNVFLVSLINIDNSVNEESRNKILDQITFLENNLKYMTLSDKIKEETEKYIIKGKKLFYNDVKVKDEEFVIVKSMKTSSELNKKVQPDKIKINGYEEGFDGIANKTFEF